MSEIEKETVVASPDAPVEKKKGGKKIILIAVVLVLLLGGGGAGFYFWRIAGTQAAEVPDKKAGEKKTSNKKTEAESDPEIGPKGSKKSGALESAIPEDEEVKQIVELPPFIVNLADTEQARYLRMTVSLGVAGEESEKPDQLFITRVRNAMLAVLSEKSSEQILTAEGKTKLRKELLQAAKAASTEPEVKAIYITDFIVQL
ncbi:MAG TPA: flagellar basal body-associated FliL family protein [Pyrinomonadaceae bacterium]|nr:flagellar basal body-associated FliL family protein [Acidobacteriota bacterium]HQZ95563.1 flagellar basal body-associated FliL family protein [Pyrinomonadaceae bacterium]